MDLEVARVDRTTVEVPYRPVHARNMRRQWPSWKYFEVCELELGCGAVGHGETMLFYGWGRTDGADVERALGGNAADLMFEDSLGPGLQMALLDAVGRATGVPVHALLGGAVHDRVPLSWWCNDMPAEDWVAETETALDRGYTHIKLKGRPWFDIRAQVEAVADATPESFSVDIDFNSTLLDAQRALPLLEELAAHPQVETVEGPIPDEDVEGYRRLRSELDVDVARHFGDVENAPVSVGGDGPVGAICQGLCDGFVVCDGARETGRQAAVARAADKPFFIQQVGTGITAAFGLHLAAAASHATWPAVNCFQIFEEDLLLDPIAVSDGTAPVPDGPGLGHEVDTALLEDLSVEKPESEPQPPRLMRAHWPREGVVMYFAEGQQMPDTAREGGMPYYQRDATAELVADDGSGEWADLRERALEAPVRVSADAAPF